MNQKAIMGLKRGLMKAIRYFQSDCLGGVETRRTRITGGQSEAAVLRHGEKPKSRIGLWASDGNISVS